VGREGEAILAGDIFRLVVVVAHRIANLNIQHPSAIAAPRSNPACILGIGSTYVHIERLPISPTPADNGRYYHQLFFGNKVANTSLVPRRFVWLDCVDLEFKGGCKRDCDEEEQTIQ